MVEELYNLSSELMSTYAKVTIRIWRDLIKQMQKQVADTGRYHSDLLSETCPAARMEWADSLSLFTSLSLPQPWVEVLFL